MKIVCLIILLFAAGPAITFAQTNPSTTSSNAIQTAAATNSPAPVTRGPVMPATRGPTTITADGPAECDLNNHSITYCDHVRVSDADVKLTCEWVKAIFPQNWERPTNIIAETNVIIDYIAQNGEKTHATGEKAVDIYQEENGQTNDTMILTGNDLRKPRIEQARGYFTADKLIWDRTHGKFYTEGQFEGVGNPDIAPPNLKNTGAATNSLAAKPEGTNAAAAPASTNSP